MKKVFTIFIAFVFCTQFVGAVTGNIQGNVGGALGVSGGVLIQLEVVSHGPYALIYQDTISTDSLGKYEFNYNFPTTATSGVVRVYLYDCNSQINGDSILWDSSYTRAEMNLIFCDTSSRGYVISGLTKYGPFPSGEAVVYLIQSTPGPFLTAIDSMVLSNYSMGMKYFFYVNPGTYYVKAAALPNNPGYSYMIPTYFDKKLKWDSATALNVTTAGYPGTDIQMIMGTNPGGPGFIGGLVSAGANKVAGPGDPLKDIDVLLMDDQGNAVKHTTSDQNGEYAFDSLSYGTYHVFVDILNKTSHERVINLSESEDSVLDASFVVHESYVSTGISPIAIQNKITLFPNPTDGLMTINLDNTPTHPIQFIVRDLTGKLIYENYATTNEENKSLNINLNSIDQGVYILELFSENFTNSQRIVKNSQSN